ncbi:hypothetical protein PR048_009890 [Dryococelus australis]|uniref:Uncharacterized protein n=1 Tax=Dryococelus australis TaxID=614101 RepID=A0ABQ9I180_9NEOP|nr:hypothetical protein PR048_009890 [Dryococelus australis]
MDNTIHDQSNVTQNITSCTEVKEDNGLEKSHSETHKTFDNEHPLNSNILNGDDSDKCELLNGREGGDVFNIKSKVEGSKHLDDIGSSDIKNAAEDKSQNAGDNLEMEAIGASCVPVENASESTENGSKHEKVTVEEEEWMDILGSGQLKKKVS